MAGCYCRLCAAPPTDKRQVGADYFSLPKARSRLLRRLGTKLRSGPLKLCQLIFRWYPEVPNRCSFARPDLTTVPEVRAQSRSEAKSKAISLPVTNASAYRVKGARVSRYVTGGIAGNVPHDRCTALLVLRWPVHDGTRPSPATKYSVRQTALTKEGKYRSAKVQMTK